MAELRCKTPKSVRKEIWTHVLAYNLIRTLTAQAAKTHGVLPRTISFQGTMQAVAAFQPMIERHAIQDAALRLRVIAWQTDQTDLNHGRRKNAATTMPG